ncbi:MAG: DUF4388 domain-containing protein [Acidobacteriota bacterium]
MGFDGKLAERGAIEVCKEILGGRRSGDLLIKKGAIEYKFHFMYGAVTGLDGSGFLQKYGEVLRHTGRINHEKWSEINDGVATAGAIDTALVKGDHFTRKELKDHRIATVKEALHSTFSWQQGEYVFTDIRPSRDMSEMEMSLPTADLLLDGVRKLDDAIVEKALSEFMTTKIKAPLLARVEAQMKSLRPEEGFVLSRIDGTVTVEEVCAISTLPREQTLKVVYALVAADMLEFDIPDAVAEKKKTFGSASGEERSTEEMDFDLSGVGLKDEDAAGRKSGPVPRSSGGIPKPSGAIPRQSGAIPRSGAIRPGGADDDDAGETKDGLTPRERKAKARDALEIGRKYIQREAYQKAVPHIKEAIGFMEKDPEAWYLLGQAQAKVQGSRKEAEEALMKAIDLNVKNADYYVELGLLYKSMGMEQKARTQFQNALKWDPVHNVARLELKREGMNAIKEDLSEALGGVKETVDKLWKDVFKGKKK